MEISISRSAHQLALQGSIGAAALLTLAALTACAASSDTSTGSLSATTCKGLIPQVIKLSKDNASATSGTVIIAVYRPRLLVDHISAYNAGKWKIPTGKDSVNVLECSGQGTASDGSTGAIKYQLSIDTNNNQFVAVQAR